MLIESTFDLVVLSELEGDSNELFFFTSNLSFKFTVTSPQEMSTFFVTIPISLCPKEI